MPEPNEFLVRTCVATADHLGDVVRLHAIQLSEHRIDLDSGRLEEIFIDPACRESGLGTRFLQAMMTECEARDCGALDLEIDAGHERVRSLYRRHGFEELPRRRLVRRLAAPGGA